MKEHLKKYVREFNENDKEYYKQLISNDEAEKWLEENIPLIEIPDKTIEKIYYFRWWTFRKHIKSTEDGCLITEFLPEVLWGGKHNTIIAAAGHHIAEAKWLKCGEKLIEDYTKFWLDEKSYTYLYSSWIIYALYEYCKHINDFSFGIKNIDLLVKYYETTAKEHGTPSGLFWSIDGNDAMECSISGTNVKHEREKGVRPTLNSYMAANAFAISEFAKRAGDSELSEKYFAEYKKIKEKINEILWDGSFYKAIHTGEFETPSISDIPPERNAKELIGYIPWCFNLAPDGREKAFRELKNTDGFATQFGFTTAEQRHPRYLYETEHECMWNGYIWPFATSQVLSAACNLLENYNQDVLKDREFCDMLKIYAQSHTLTENGKTVCWIDEAKDPRTDIWSCREILKNDGWKPERGGKERGKDYNHSTFCDLVLGGLLGIKANQGEISVSPKFIGDFKVDNLWIGGEKYKIVCENRKIEIIKKWL
ncbi:MAG: hypothetical protein IKW02_00630 [Clostridia bacterium]|nr:hypothetical protein [Clostridia bacterium]